MQLFNNMKLRTKMILGFSLTILLMLIALFVSVSGLRLNSNQFSKMADISMETNLSSDINSKLFDSLFAFNDYVATQNPEAKETFQRLTTEMQMDIVTLANLSNNSNRLEYIDQVSKKLTAYSDLFESYELLEEEHMTYYDTATSAGSKMFILLEMIEGQSSISGDLQLNAVATKCSSDLVNARLHAMKFFTFHKDEDYNNYAYSYTNYRTRINELTEIAKDNTSILEIIKSNNDSVTLYSDTMKNLRSVILQMDVLVLEIVQIENEITKINDMIMASVIDEQRKIEAESYNQSNTLTTTAISAAIISVLLIILVSIIILKSVITPIKALKSTFDSISEGDVDFDFRLNEEAKDEIGDMAKSFNEFMIKLEAIMSNIAKQNHIKTAENDLHILSRDIDDFNTLLDETLGYICKFIEAQVGVLYLTSNREAKLTASYAYSGEEKIIHIGEGLVGQCMKEQKMKILNKLPQGYFNIASGIGQTEPSTLFIMPCIQGENLEAILEIGLMDDITDAKVELLTSLSLVLAQSLHSARISNEMKVLLEKTISQAEELRVQQEELRQSNEELEEQTRALKDSEQRLQAQQEELRVSNEELEQRGQALLEQKKSVDEMNVELLNKQTEIMEKAKALEIANKYKSEFLANMSHELRTPLNSILVLSQLLLDRENIQPLSEKEFKFITTIHSSGDDLLKLINGILDLSKVESGKLEVNFEPVALKEILTDSQILFGPMAEIKNINFKTNFDEGLPTAIETDILRLNQILKNLIGNALKFTETGSVTLSIRKPSALEYDSLGTDQNAFIAFEVADTGIGIHEDKHQVIFDAFRQADGTTSRKYGGTGLGLTITKDLTGLLGGEILLESIIGEGSKFVLLLPLRQEDYNIADDKEFEVPSTDSIDMENEANEILSVEIANTFSPSVLVLGNLDAYLKEIQELALNNDLDCHFIKSPDHTINMIESHNPSAIIIEEQLTDSFGKDIKSLIKRNSSSMHVPIMDIQRESEDSELAIPSNIIGYLNEPITIKSIYKTMATIETASDTKEKFILIVGPCGNESFNAFRNFAKVEKALLGSEVLKHLSSGAVSTIILDYGFNDLDLQNTLFEDFGHLPVILYSKKELNRKEIVQLAPNHAPIILDNKPEKRIHDELTLFFHDLKKKLKVLEGKTAFQKQYYMDELKNQIDVDEQLKGKRILVVDDDDRNIFALTNLLKRHHLEVTVASNGAESIEMLKENPSFNLILMDIMMPKLDGIQAIEAIKNMPEVRDLPIIVLTAKAMKETRDRCMEAGASDYMTKPLDADRLISLLKVWIT